MKTARLCIVALMALALAAAAAETDIVGDAAVRRLWREPEFQRAFLGSYGINADVEPSATPAEREIISQLLPLMSASLVKAAAFLAPQVKADSSALLDYTLGNIYFQQDRLDKALARFRTAVTKYPAFRRAWRNLGLIYTRNAQHAEAIQAFTAAVSLGGADAYLYGLLAFAYTARQDYPAAEAAYRAALLFQPESVEWRMGLCRVAFKQGKFEEASALLEAMIERQPDRAEFWLLQANAFVGMKKMLKAAENFSVVAMLGKATPESLHMLGDIYVSEQLPVLAADAYTQALRADADSAGKPDRHVQNVELLAARGALAEAETLRKAVVDTLGTNLSAQAQGRLLRIQARMALSRGEGGAAAQVLEEALALNPLDGEVLMLLGQHYAASGDTEKASLYYERAAGIEKYEADSRMRQSQLLVKAGRFQEALPLLKRVQELRPREDVARYIEQVERIARGKN